MSNKSSYDWKELMGRKVIFEGREAILEQKTEGNMPFCLKDERANILIEFHEEGIIDAYEGKSGVFHFVDEDDDEISDFLGRKKSRAERIYRKANFKDRIKTLLMFCGDAPSKIQKLATFSTLKRETIEKYLNKQQIALCDIGLFVMAVKRYLQEEVKDSELAKAVSIKKMSQGLSKNCYKELGVKNAEQLRKALAKKVYLEKTIDTDDFQGASYAFDLIRDWQELRVAGRALQEVYVPIKVKQKGRETERVEIFLDRFVKSKEQKCVLLGDIGAGKTTVLQAFCARQSERHIDNPQREPLPIYINLARITESKELEILYENILSEIIEGKTDGIGEIRKLAKRGRVVFVVDSLEEVVPRLSDEGIYQLLQQLKEDLQGKVIIGSAEKTLGKDGKMADFINQAGLKKYLDNAAKIKAFSKKDVKKYFRSWPDKECNDNFQQLKKIRGFRRVSANPMLLEMVVQIIPELSLKKKLTKKSIISTYYANLAKERRSNGQQEIKGTVLSDFCQILALTLKQLRYVEVSYSRLKRGLSKYFDPNDSAIIEGLTMAATRNSFLIRNGNLWSFKHKLWEEYFLTEAIKNK